MLLSTLNNIFKFSINYVKKGRKQPVTFKRWQIVSGDIVKIRAGNDKGKVSNVIRVFRKSNKILVRGVNVRTGSKIN